MILIQLVFIIKLFFLMEDYYSCHISINLDNFYTIGNLI
jgi:hypothetical protein